VGRCSAPSPWHAACSVSRSCERIIGQREDWHVFDEAN
jgi:hypothetical protein